MGKKAKLPKPVLPPPEPVRVPSDAELRAEAELARTGGGAFPASPFSSRGMTLLDYFAGQALPGVMAHALKENFVDGKMIAEDCYDLAGAMIRARKAAQK